MAFLVLLSYLSNYGRLLVMTSTTKTVYDPMLIYHSFYLLLCFLGLTVDNLFYRHVLLLCRHAVFGWLSFALDNDDRYRADNLMLFIVEV